MLGKPRMTQQPNIEGGSWQNCDQKLREQLIAKYGSFEQLIPIQNLKLRKPGITMV